MLTRVVVFAALLGIIGIRGGAADDSAFVTFKVLSPTVALEAAQAALSDCQGKGFQVAVTVVDRFGVSQVMLRDRFAGPHTPETSRRKAWTAVSFRSDTVALSDSTAAGQPASGVRFVTDVLMLGGGVPVEAAGSIVGAVGVSGAPGGSEDDACARAGIAAVADKIAF